MSKKNLSYQIAWETTTDDLDCVLIRNGMECDQETLDSFMKSIDCDEVAKAALEGDEMDEQMIYAHAEIENQLKKAMIIS
jgi:hypothetical protein